MTKAMEKELAYLREQVAALRGDLDALQAKVERMPGYENDDQSELAELEAKGKGEVAPIEVAPIEIGAEDLKFVRAMTEKDAQQIIVQTKSVKINVADKTTLEKATLKNQKITVPAPTNLGESQLVVIDLINKDGGKLFTLAYVKTNAQGLYLELRGAAEQKKFHQQEDQQKG
jgi:hypothetical protein